MCDNQHIISAIWTIIYGGQTWGQIHLYLKVFKYFVKVFVFDL